MYLGRLVELAERDALFERAAPSLRTGAAVGGAGARSGAEAETLHWSRRRCAEPGAGAGRVQLPSAMSDRAGSCRESAPPLRSLGDGRSVACHFAKPFPIAA